VNMSQTLKSLALRLGNLSFSEVDEERALAEFDLSGADEATRKNARDIARRAVAAFRQNYMVGSFDASIEPRLDPDDERSVSRARQSGAQMIHPAESKVRPGAVSETNPDRMRSITSPEQDGIRNANNASVARGLGNLRGIDVGATAGPPVLKGEAEGETPTHGPHHWEEPRKFPAELAAVLAGFEGLDAMAIAKHEDIKAEIDRLIMQADGLAKEAQSLRDAATPGWETIWRSKLDEAQRLMKKAKAMMEGQTA
jgi:hypothetical protein